LIEVDVRIDETWKNCRAAKIGAGRALGNFIGRNNGMDYLAVDKDGRWTDAARSHNSLR
jgi:hypothetical protein